ncbi:MAG: dynamin family protein [Ideonella sp.]|nr:dynamin family protein [Ideonella sp.]
MSSTLSRELDALADWRKAMDRRVEQFGTLLGDHDLLDADGMAMVQTLRQRLSSDRLVLAFVAEFSRGKSELINALFFADSGRRILPATPGRTTMCPVELAWDASEAASLCLLPIGTRRDGLTVSALRGRMHLWQRVALPLGNPEGLAEALQEVTQTQLVSLDDARALGFWDDENPNDNPPRGDDDRVEVPAWRHALINYPHPLLKRGLVVIDTPGLNAIGAEPELTLGLLPSAHATVFLLAADAGVTRSDLAIWRDHLGDRGLERFVVLNKIDALNDPLLSAEQVAAQVQRQREQVATTLAVSEQRVFPLSARQALSARMGGDQAGLLASGLPALEQALANQLLPERGSVVGRLIEDGALALQQVTTRRINDRRRQLADQLAELGSLRGKSSSKLLMMSSRFQREAAAFEECLPRLTATRAVHSRLLQSVMRDLSSERVRLEVQPNAGRQRGQPVSPRCGQGIRATGPAPGGPGRSGREEHRRDRSDAGGQPPADERRIRFCLVGRPQAGAHQLPPRAQAHRGGLWPVLWPDQAVAPVRARLPGTVPAGAAVALASGVRECGGGSGALGQDLHCTARIAAARTPPRAAQSA